MYKGQHYVEVLAADMQTMEKKSAVRVVAVLFVSGIFFLLTRSGVAYMCESSRADIRVLYFV